MREDWSNGEKKIARAAFERARLAVLDRTLADFRSRSAALKSIDDMWSLIDDMRYRQREIEELLDYRYSQLTTVFGRLIRLGHLNESELQGLSPDKLDAIRYFVARTSRP